MNIKEMIEQTTSVAEYTNTASAIAELRSRLSGVAYDVTTTKGMDAAKRDRGEVRGLRTSLEKMRQDIKAPALDRCRLIDSEAKRITAELLELEEPIDDQIKVEERRKEEEKLARIQAEFGRVQAIQDAIGELHMEAIVTGKSSDFIAERLSDLNGRTLDPLVFQELMQQAQAARTMVVTKLETALAAQKFAEAEAERVAAERRELEELRAAKAQQKAKDEAAAAELRKSEQARIDAELAAQRAEQRRLDEAAAAVRAEEDRKAAAARAEAQAAHQAAMKAEAEAAAEARRIAEEKAVKELAKKRKAEASEQKLRDAAPVMLKALQKIHSIQGMPAEALLIIEETILETI